MSNKLINIPSGTVAKHLKNYKVARSWSVICAMRLCEQAKILQR